MAVTAMLSHKKLKGALRAREITEERFAKRLGITDRHLRNLITRDTNSSCSLLYRVSKELGVPMEELIEVRETDEEQRWA